MTVNNIVNMALIKGLELIAVTDHNTMGQQAALADASGDRIRLLYGTEIETKEEVHILGYFRSLAQALSLQPWLDRHLPYTANDPGYFGHQYYLDGRDRVIGEERKLLIRATDASLSETCAQIHRCGGKAVLAHVLGRTNSVTTQLGFIPPDLDYDGLEVSSRGDRERLLREEPWIARRDPFWLTSSDAHRLTDIAEAGPQLSPRALAELLGEAP